MKTLNGHESVGMELQQLLTVVVPVFNEISGLAEFWNRLDRALETLPCSVEVIFVDNCSDDGSSDFLRQLALEQQRVKYLRFSRNFGPSVEASITAGLTHGDGDAFIVIYSDLQDPPEMIPELVDYWGRGYDVVYGIQQRRLGEAFWRRSLVKVYYRLLNLLSDTRVPPNAGDFRLMTRRVVTVLLQMPELDRYTRGLISWIGFNQIGIPYTRQPRLAGRSKAGVWAIFGTAWTGITGFSLKPLRIMTFSGLLLSLVLVLVMIFFAVLALFGTPVPGLTSILVFVLFGTSLNLAALGLLGEYIGRIHTQVKKRPLFVIAESLNIRDSRWEHGEL